MGSGASKAARKLPTSVPSAAAAARGQGVARAAQAAEAAAAQEAAPSPATASTATPAPEQFDYGRGRQEKPSFSGEKDEALMKDAMDPQFAANLAALGQVKVPEAARTMRTPSFPQRTLNARRAEYTNPTLTPPPGTLSAQSLSSLLDALKSLPPGGDPDKLYAHFGLDPALMKDVRRWVNSPSVAGEETRMTEGGGQTVEQVLEMRAVWIDGKDKGARE